MKKRDFSVHRTTFGRLTRASVDRFSWIGAQNDQAGLVNAKMSITKTIDQHSDFGEARKAKTVFWPKIAHKWAKKFFFLKFVLNRPGHTYLPNFIKIGEHFGACVSTGPKRSKIADDTT